MKHDLKILAASLGLLSVVSSTAFADSAASAPTLGSVLEASGITATGYVAGSYYHSSTANVFAPVAPAVVGTIYPHVFDTSHDSFQLDQASLTVAYQPKEGFGAVAQVIAGEDARWLNYYSSYNILSTVSTGTSASAFNIAQAFVQYAGGPVTLIGGKFYTLAGAEVTAPTGNTNFSRSLLFSFEPAQHTGVRATIAASDMFSFSLGLNNGWNYDKNSEFLGGTPFKNTSARTGEVGVTFTPAKAFSLVAVGYFGKDPYLDAKKTLLDLVATFNVTDALSFIVSYDNGSQEFVGGAPKAKWDGIAAYANVKFNDQWRLSLRLEQFKDKDGFITGTAQKLKEGTLTLGFAPAESYEFRAEIRKDKSDQSTFMETDYFDTLAATGTGSTTDSQTEFAFQGVYKF